MSENIAGNFPDAFRNWVNGRLILNWQEAQIRRKAGVLNSRHRVGRRQSVPSGKRLEFAWRNLRDIEAI
jgi:hypothetical protein